jgi:uncharacterized protein (TIGR02271 family)
MKTSDQNDKDKNRDPLSGAPGAHPVGTGLGAAAGGAAAGAAAGSVAGPAGTIAGIVVGGIGGGLAGKAIAEKIDPTREDEYWRENHSRQPFGSRPYDQYRSAYRAGYNSFSTCGGGRFEDNEAEIRRRYEAEPENSRLRWDEARPAAQAAWQRVSRTSFSDSPERLIDCEVRDQNDESVGKVHNVWTDEAGEPVFLGVKTGWLFGKNHVVPVHTAKVNVARRIIQLPFSKQKIKDAPSFDADSELSDADVATINRYYEIGVAPGADEARAPSGTASEKTLEQETVVPLREETLKVGKREVEAGSVRIRKVVRTETVNQPVELRREEVVIEHVPADAARVGSSSNAPIGEEDLYIPLRREEPVVQKETRVKEGVRVGRKAQTERQNVSDEVRIEEIEVERNEEARR